MVERFLYERPVFKIGTSTLTGGTSYLSLARLANLVEQVVDAHRSGVRPIVVSSGAIAAGRQRLGFPRDQKDVSFKQVLAAVGQSRLMHLYDQFFDFHGVTSAQVLLTRADLSERQRYLNARNTLLGLCERAVIPIINENDAVAADEIKVGDNDTLSALVANLVDADLLVLVSDIAGLFTSDPQIDPGARLVEEVPAITQSVEAFAGDVRSGLGTGGMATKIAAAKLATASGAQVHIVDGGVPDALLRVLRGERIGTHFQSRTNPMESRKRWILSGLSRPGKVLVDGGAARALLQQGASLLPAGVIQVEGKFERGDPIDILDREGRRIARGVANYNAADTESIGGKRSSDIERILGYSYGDHLVHRDDLVCFVSEAAHV